MKNIVIGALLASACFLSMGLTSGSSPKNDTQVSVELAAMRQPEAHVGGGWGAPYINFSGADSSYYLQYGQGLELQWGACSARVILHLDADRSTTRYMCMLYPGEKNGVIFNKIFKSGSIVYLPGGDSTENMEKVVAFHRVTGTAVQ